MPRVSIKALAFVALHARRSPRIITIAVVSVIVACGFTEARVQRKPQTYDWLPKADGASKWVASAEPSAGPVETRAYDVKALVEAFPASSKQDTRITFRELVKTLVTRGKQPEDSPTVDSESVRIEQDALIVSAPRSVHDELADTMSAWATSGFDQITVECRITTSEQDLATGSKIAWQYFDGSGADDGLLSDDARGETAIVSATTGVENAVPICSTTLNREQLVQFINAAQRDRRTNIMFAPKMTVWNATSALLSSQLRQPFVVGVHHSETGERQPQVKIAHEGLKFKLRPTRSVDGRSIRLAGGIEISRIVDVVTVTTTMADGPATLQFPRVSRCRINLASDVPIGETLLVGCVPSYERKEFLYLTLTPKIVGP
jgi:hypothetical protein